MPMSRVARSGRLGVRGWFYSAIGVMVVLVVFFSVIGAVLLDRASQASDTLIDRVSPVATAVADMQGDLVDEETGVRGYLLTHDPAFLQPYAAGQTAQAADARQIGNLEPAGSPVLGDLASIEQSVTAWTNTYAAPFIHSIAAGTPVGDARLAASKTAFDRLRAKFAGITADLTAQHRADQANLAHIERVRDWTFIGMLATFLATVCAVVILVRTAVLRPLNRLRQEAEAVREGSFDAPLSSTGPRDIRALGIGMEAMRSRLATAIAATERQRAILHEQKEILDSQAAELRRSNEELEQFAYVASHDLQEPLRKVSSFCQLIEKRYGELLDDRGKQYIDYAVDGAKRMQTLINDLLAFSRVGRIDDRSEPVELQSLITGVLDGLEYTVRETKATVAVPQALPTVTGNPTLLGMLLQNLIGNALKFRAPEIDIAWQPAPDHVGLAQLAVTDNGIGIAPEFAEKVFVIFKRLHGREAYAGTGIGLALCKKIAEHHGGRIWIDTTWTSGTRVLFTLPLTTDDPGPEPTPDAAKEGVAV
ncbi:MAG TPA: ATP-binding protein [Actinospica sp.]|nr:ATP-binding protein [Actinospica sp.]